MKRLAVYCGSASPADPAFVENARHVGTALAARGIGLVYGGGRMGLMGAIADAVLAAGGEVIGVIPEALVAAEVAHRGLSELHVVETMHERKRLMAEHADAFLALPGGIGTFEELFETWTWRQLGYHNKPLGLLNQDGYYDALLALVRHSVGNGFMDGSQMRLIEVGTEWQPLLQRLIGAAGFTTTVRLDTI